MASLVLLFSELLRPADANLLAADCFRTTRGCSASTEQHARTNGTGAGEKPVLLRFNGKREDHVGVVDDPVDAKFAVDDSIWP